MFPALYYFNAIIIKPVKCPNTSVHVVSYSMWLFNTTRLFCFWNRTRINLKQQNQAERSGCTPGTFLDRSYRWGVNTCPFRPIHSHKQLLRKPSLNVSDISVASEASPKKDRIPGTFLVLTPDWRRHTLIIPPLRKTNTLGGTSQTRNREWTELVKRVGHY